ncbi:unnamed protein product [Scytosiphon promiscuus]
MSSIDMVEVLAGTLGLACSVYDPWIGDPYASVLVTFTRTAGICSLFLAVALLLATLIPLRAVDADPTTLTVVFFAAGSSAPTLGRGAWSLIDAGSMFMDLLRESFGIDNDQNNSNINGSATTTAGPRPFGVSSFVEMVFTVFFVLMRHNVSWETLTPYAESLFTAFRNNWEGVVHGQSILDGVAVCRVSPENWATRVKCLFNILVLNFVGFFFLLLQSVAAVGEAILLSIGAAWISLAIAAHGREFMSCVRPTATLQDVVIRLICCETCHHGGNSGRNLSESANSKTVSNIMPKVIKRSEAGRNGTDIRCTCCFCSWGCPRA